MAITTLSQVKDHLGVAAGDKTKDAQLGALLLAADAAVKRYCGRDFEQQTYTQYYSGNNKQYFVLRQRPVTALSELYLDYNGFYDKGDDTPFSPDTLLQEGRDYVVDWDTTGTKSKSGLVYRIGTVWPVLYRVATLSRLTPFQGPTFGNIKVVYTAGYPAAEMPEDLKYAVTLMVAYMRRTVPFGGHNLMSERLGDYSYRLLKTASTQSAESRGIDMGTVDQILAHYREMPF